VPLPVLSAGFAVSLAPTAANTLHMMSLWLQEAAPGSTFIATMSSQEEVDEWRSKPKTLGGVNEHVYWGYPNDPTEVPP
jgi:hypothetical protein